MAEDFSDLDKIYSGKEATFEDLDTIAAKVRSDVESNRAIHSKNLGAAAGMDERMGVKSPIRNLPGNVARPQDLPTVSGEIGKALGGLGKGLYNMIPHEIGPVGRLVATGAGFPMAHPGDIGDAARNISESAKSLYWSPSRFLSGSSEQAGQEAAPFIAPLALGVIPSAASAVSNIPGKMVGPIANYAGKKLLGSKLTSLIQSAAKGVNKGSELGNVEPISNLVPPWQESTVGEISPKFDKPISRDLTISKSTSVIDEVPSDKKFIGKPTPQEALAKNVQDVMKEKKGSNVKSFEDYVKTPDIEKAVNPKSPIPPVIQEKINKLRNDILSSEDEMQKFYKGTDPKTLQNLAKQNDVGAIKELKRRREAGFLSVGDKEPEVLPPDEKIGPFEPPPKMNPVADEILRKEKNITPKKKKIVEK